MYVHKYNNTNNNILTLININSSSVDGEGGELKILLLQSEVFCK